MILIGEKIVEVISKWMTVTEVKEVFNMDVKCLCNLQMEKNTTKLQPSLQLSMQRGIF